MPTASRVCLTEKIKGRMIMKKTMIAATFIVIAFAAYGFSRPPLPAQETITGDWAAKGPQTEKGQRLWPTLKSAPENGKPQFNSGFEPPLAAFPRLNPDAGSNVSFSLQREAGAVVF